MLHNSEESMSVVKEAPLRKSLFSNVPPFLNYLPNGKSGAEASPSAAHTNTMVDIRESLWRVPAAFNMMVNQEEELRSRKVKTIVRVLISFYYLPFTG